MKLLKELLILVVALLLLTSLGWFAYSNYGHKLISDIFHGQSFSFLNSFIENNTNDPVDYYLNLGDKLAIRGIFLLWVGGIFAWLIYLAYRKKFLIFFFYNIFAVAIIYELIIILLLAFPKPLAHLPQSLMDYMRFIYLTKAVNVLNAQSDKFSYDSELTYTFSKNNNFKFKEREFDTDIHTNSQGLRDDEESLVQPEIIVLGDSFGMGWGVEQSETFPELIEAQTGKKVLNASIPSYGTVRELIMLKRLDLSNLKTLIIQYCSNDFAENRSYLTNNKLKIKSEKAYRQQLDYFEKDHSYFFGKYFIYIYTTLRSQFVNFWKRNFLSERQKKKVTGEQHAEDFYQVINKLLTLDIPIIVLNLNGYNAENDPFIDALEKILTREKSKFDIKLVRNDEVLNDPDFFILDSHINKSGHKKVADLLIKNL